MSVSADAKKYLMSLLSSYPDMSSRVDEIVDAFDRYTELLIAWNRIHNLTAFKSKEEILIRGIIDSLLVLSPEVNKVVQLTEHSRTGDLGSGAGFPGIPLAVVMPAVEFTLIEASHKKAAFLTFIAAELGLENVKVFRGRAEEFYRLIEGKEEKPFDIIFSRAAAKLNRAAKLSCPLLRKGGKLVIWSSTAELMRQEAALKENLTRSGCKFYKVKPDSGLQLSQISKTVFLVIEKC